MNQTMKNRITVSIATRNRSGYLAMCLSSLLPQTEQNFDVVIVDNCSKINQFTIPIVRSVIQRLRLSGHIVKEIRTPNRLGNPMFRQVAFENDTNPIGVRVDDDSWVEPDYLEILKKHLLKHKDAGAVGGICPPMHTPKLFMPVPKIFNEVTEFYDTVDNCTNFFHGTEGKAYPTGHIRSAFMYWNKIMKEIGSYEGMEVFGITGHREETDVCIRFTLYGYQNYFVPSAVAWHLFAPRGGGRDKQDGGLDHRNEVFDNDQIMKTRCRDLKAKLEAEKSGSTKAKRTKRK